MNPFFGCHTNNCTDENRTQKRIFVVGLQCFLFYQKKAIIFICFSCRVFFFSCLGRNEANEEVLIIFYLPFTQSKEEILSIN